MSANVTAQSTVYVNGVPMAKIVEDARGTNVIWQVYGPQSLDVARQLIAGLLQLIDGPAPHLYKSAPQEGISAPHCEKDLSVDKQVLVQAPAFSESVARQTKEFEMAAPKLTDDPRVVELLEKELAKQAKAFDKERVALQKVVDKSEKDREKDREKAVTSARKAVITEIKARIADRSAAAKESGDKVLVKFYEDLVKEFTSNV